MKFSMVLNQIELYNQRWTRLGWNGSNQYIQLLVPDEYSKMNVPYLFISTKDGLSPWTPTHKDMFSDDWVKLSDI